MWPLYATLIFHVLLFLATPILAGAARPIKRTSQRVFRAAAAASSRILNVSDSSSGISKDAVRHGSVDSLSRRPYCTLGGPGTRSALKGIEIWVDAEANTRYIRSGNPSNTALAARCQGLFKKDECLQGHPMNGAPPDCGSLHCPCSVDTSWPVPSLRDGKLRAAQASIVKEVGRLCAQRSGSFSVLVLGLRNAVLPAYLEKRCPRRLRIDTVESDQHVVDAARAFLGLKHDEQSSITCTDSWQFLMRLNGTKKRYDAILTDCYGADGHIPATCRAPSFIARLRAILKPGGLSLQDVGSEASKSLLMGYNAAFGRANVALMGRDDVALNFTASGKRPREQMIRAVARPIRSAESKSNASAIAVEFASNASETSVERKTNSSVIVVKPNSSVVAMKPFF